MSHTNTTSDTSHPSDTDHRWVSIERLDEGIYLARNARGHELRFGSKDPDGFSPVELFLTSIAGCTAVDVDVVTGRRSARRVVRRPGRRPRAQGRQRQRAARHHADLPGDLSRRARPATRPGRSCRASCRPRTTRPAPSRGPSKPVRRSATVVE